MFIFKLKYEQAVALYNCHKWHSARGNTKTALLLRLYLTHSYE